MISGHGRYFFALFPPQPVRRRLVRLSRSEAAHLDRPVGSEKLHLTLLYLGKVDDDQCHNLITGIGRGHHSRFSFEISRSGRWQRAEVAWLAPLSWPETLDDLVADITRVSLACGLMVPERAFCPHITIARGQRRPFSCEFTPINWEIRDFCLVESISHGRANEYKIIHTWALS